MEHAIPLAVSAAGQIIALGQRANALVVVRFARDGTPLPLRTWQGPLGSEIQAWDMALRADGSAVIVASFEVLREAEGLLIGIDPNGLIEYAHELELRLPDSFLLDPLRVLTAASGSAYVVGVSRSVLGFGVAVMQYSRSGALRWRRDAYNSGGFFPQELIVDAQDRLSVYLSLDNAPAFIGEYITTFSTDGTLVNARFPMWSDPTISFGNAMAMQNSGRLLLSGTSGFSGDSIEMIEWHAQGAPCTHWRISVDTARSIQPLAATRSFSGDWLLAAMIGVRGNPDGYAVALWKISADSECTMSELNQLGFEDPAYFLPPAASAPNCLDHSMRRSGISEFATSVDMHTPLTQSRPPIAELLRRGCWPAIA